MLDTIETYKVPRNSSSVSKSPRNSSSISKEILNQNQNRSLGKSFSFNMDAVSMQPNDGSKPVYVGGCPSDDVSAPTVEGSFSDEDFSLDTEKDFPSTHDLHMHRDDNENLSLSSINTKALLQITELSKRLRIQENTKLELLNQCLQLEGRLEKNDCKHAYLRIYKTENNQLRESSAKMERDFMNDMNEIVIKMKEMDRDYTEKLEERDDKIERLEEELKLLKVAKNLDNISTIDNISLMGSVSGASSSVTNSR